jgi:hypothetical protein
MVEDKLKRRVRWFPGHITNGYLARYALYVSEIHHVNVVVQAIAEAMSAPRCKTRGSKARLPELIGLLLGVRSRRLRAALQSLCWKHTRSRASLIVKTLLFRRFAPVTTVWLMGACV